MKRAQTVYTIQRKAGALAAIQVNSKQLHKWLAEKNKDENKYNQAIETFKRSCAGYCVATFILGKWELLNCFSCTKKKLCPMNFLVFQST